MRLIDKNAAKNVYISLTTCSIAGCTVLMLLVYPPHHHQLPALFTPPSHIHPTIPLSPHPYHPSTTTHPLANMSNPMPTPMGGEP